MSKTITPEDYAKLEGIATLDWHPVYVGYKTRKVREYDECDMGYRHFVGWVEQTTPIGEPLHYGYKKASAQAVSMHHMQMMYSKRFLEQSVHNFVDNTDASGKTISINFTRNDD